MSSQNFIYWLEGYLAACGGTLNEAQISVVREKLTTVVTDSIASSTYNPWTTRYPGTTNPSHPQPYVTCSS